MDTSAKETPEVKKLSEEMSPEIIEAGNLIINTTAMLESATSMIKGFKALKKKINDTFDPHIKRAYESHKSLVAEKKGFTKPLEDAERLLKGKMGTYLDDEEKKRKQEEVRLAEVARKEQEKLINNANKKIDKLFEKSQGYEEQLKILNGSLCDPGILDIEASVIRAKILSIETKTQNNTVAIEDQQIKVEESVTVPSSTIAPTPPKISGMSSRQEIIPTEVTDPG